MGTQLAAVDARASNSAPHVAGLGPWRSAAFPIVAWWGPPGTATLADFEAYRDAGFTLHATNPDEGFQRALDHVEAVGLKSLVFRQHQGFVLPALRDPPFPRDRASVVGWIVADEPWGEAQVGRVIGEVQRLRREDPSRWTFFNLLPPHLQRNPPTETVIARAVAAGMPVVSFDTYAIMREGSDRADLFYGNLARVRAAALKHGVPFWAFALTIAHRDYRRPSESDLRWQHYSNLAYGAKGLWYFTYWAPAGWKGWDARAIVDGRDGSRTELYDWVATLNAAILAMGHVLVDLRSVEVVHTRPPTGERAFPPDRHWIAGIAGHDVLVGFFEASDGTPHALVVNKLHGMGKGAADTADTIQLTFSDRVTSVEAVSWLDGVPGPLTLKRRRAALRIAGGTGVLLRAEMSAEE
ncbi:MAG TPA: hypothetical protein VNN07_17430 [Candidatus Tectomicrobia bacterium]|nr:hypothetical protein [Candidatus Tectomicrobia bacterium]